MPIVRKWTKWWICVRQWFNHKNPPCVELDQPVRSRQRASFWWAGGHTFLGIGQAGWDNVRCSFKTYSCPAANLHPSCDKQTGLKLDCNYFFQIYHTWYFKDPLIFNDKRLLTPKYSGAASLEVLCPFYFWIWFSDQIRLFCTGYKLLF